MKSIISRYILSFSLTFGLQQQELVSALILGFVEKRLGTYLGREDEARSWSQFNGPWLAIKSYNWNHLAKLGFAEYTKYKTKYFQIQNYDKPESYSLLQSDQLWSALTYLDLQRPSDIWSGEN